MLISVALCTYNGEKFIDQQIDSILNQTLKVDEIIVCDDGSSDRTIEILNQYSKNNPNLFKIYQNEQNLKSVKNFEKAIQLCSGDIIFLSDQDDIWVNEKVEHYISYFDKNPNIKVLASNGYCINEKSEVEEKYSIWDVPQFLREKKVSFTYYKLITYISNIATGASMAFKKEIIKEILPFPILKGFHHDEWIAIIASKKNTFELLNEKYFYYRIHSNQQVGGVFFDKTKQTKQFLTAIFDIDSFNNSFTEQKKSAKKLSLAYHRNKDLLKLETQYSYLFEENLMKIELAFIEMKNKMKKEHRIKTIVLYVFDRILNKRQLNPKYK